MVLEHYINLPFSRKTKYTLLSATFNSSVNQESIYVVRQLHFITVLFVYFIRITLNTLHKLDFWLKYNFAKFLNHQPNLSMVQRHSVNVAFYLNTQEVGLWRIIIFKQNARWLHASRLKVSAVYYSSLTHNINKTRQLKCWMGAGIL